MENVKTDGEPPLLPSNIQGHLVFLCAIRVICDKPIHPQTFHGDHVGWFVYRPWDDPDFLCMTKPDIFFVERLILWTVNRWCEPKVIKIVNDRFFIFHQRRQAHIGIFLVPVFQNTEVKRLNDDTIER